MTQTGAGYGLHFDFAQVTRIGDTAPAHALVLAAPADRQEAVLTALHRAHFEQGANPAEPAVLRAAWAAAGLPAASGEAALADTAGVAAVRSAAQAAARSGIGGVPHAVFSGPKGQATVHGGQAPAAFAAALGRVG